jgi:CubicO group peptidase (beta-lactamase class C family)
MRQLKLAAMAVVVAVSSAGRALPQALPAPPDLDVARVAAWADAQVQPAMQLSGIPGVVVVVVRKDRIILSKGYGLADVGRAAPMRADQTLLDTASIGKSMTAVIVSQLIDEGVLDLDEDVNHYLKTSHVTGPKVTLRMLLGHRGAFDSDLTGLFVPIDGDPGMTAAELTRRLRPVAAPGWVTAYDNQGYGVIGLVLRETTGKPLAELYRERLFDPAGMSSAVQGRPLDGDARLARCYVVRDVGSVTACPYWLYRDGLRGAGGVSASGADMARYMRMLLNDGSLDGRQVLTPRAFQALTDFDAYRFRSGMPGLARSFTQLEEFRGLEYAHGGSMPGFSSIMKIYRDADVGIFVGFLGGQPGSFDYTLTSVISGLRDLDIAPKSRAAMLALHQLSEHFADEFIPATWPRSSAGPDAAASNAHASSNAQPASTSENLDRFVGHYLATENETRSFAPRVGSWFGGVDVIRMGSDGIGVAGQGPYHRVGPYLYEDSKGRRIAFAELPVGRFIALGVSPGVFRKTNQLESPAWSLPLLLAATLFILSALPRLRAGTPGRLRRLAAAALFGYALVVVALLLEWQYGVPLAVVDGALALPALWRLGLHIGAIVLLVSAVRFLYRHDRSIGTAAYCHGVSIALASISVAIVLILWRVLATFPPYVSW